MVVPITARNAAQAKATLTTVAGGPFNPSMIANLAGWWDASDAASITASAGLVSQWNDKSGNARHVTQATGTAQPTTGTRTLNSLNVLDLQAQHYMTGPSGIMGSATAGTAFYVFRNDVNPPTGYNPAGVLERWSVLDTVTHEPYSDGIIYNDWGSSARKTLPGGQPSLATARQITVISSATEWTYRIDGSNYYTTATNTVASWGTTPRIGGENITSFFLKGIIAEICVYTRALTSGERGQVETYLKTKWGTP